MGLKLPEPITTSPAGAALGSGAAGARCAKTLKVDRRMAQTQRIAEPACRRMFFVSPGGRYSALTLSVYFFVRKVRSKFTLAAALGETTTCWLNSWGSSYSKC